MDGGRRADELTARGASGTPSPQATNHARPRRSRATPSSRRDERRATTRPTTIGPPRSPTHGRGRARSSRPADGHATPTPTERGRAARTARALERLGSAPDRAARPLPERPHAEQQERRDHRSLQTTRRGRDQPAPHVTLRIGPLVERNARSCASDSENVPCPCKRRIATTKATFIGRAARAARPGSSARGRGTTTRPTARCTPRPDGST